MSYIRAQASEQAAGERHARWAYAYLAWLEAGFSDATARELARARWHASPIERARALEYVLAHTNLRLEDLI
jgi:hypothetical protein